ncbi:MAG TPA: orotidine 5'-phosphate decarboxylase [Candidatus Bathyarchaeia archaeon]|nr:orotidine 5'-phosphate decarboxylase [Candidatus Bathyarchaeia archaeon]
MRQNSHKQFKDRILQASRSNKSRVVLAIDVHNARPPELVDRAAKLVKQTRQSICAVKLGRQTILSIGPERASRLLRTIHGYKLATIIDDKLNDIDETNVAITRTYLNFGFNAITVNPFAGWRGGLESTFKFAHEGGMGLLALVYMSHPGASEGYGQKVMSGRSKRARPEFEIFAEKAVEWDADGAVVGATRPSIVRRAKEILAANVPIFSPGVGTQGGEIARSLKAGTDYFIIGRSITKAPNPGKAAEEFARASVQDD